MECLASFAHPSPFFVSGRAATESWRRNKTISMTALSRKATDLFFFCRGKNKKIATFYQQQLNDGFAVQSPSSHAGAITCVLRSRCCSKPEDRHWGALPGDQERVPTTSSPCPTVAGGAHAWCLDAFRTGEEGMGLDALCGYTAEGSHTGSQNTTT